MKKVLIISPSNKGTIPRRSLGLYKALSSMQDVEAEIVHIHHYNKGFPEYEGSEWFQGESSFLKSVINALRRILWLRRVKKRFHPDMTISMLAGCSTTSVLSGGSDVKVGVFRAPISQIKSYFFQYYMAKLSYRFIYPHLDHLFCVSREIYNYIRNEFPWIPVAKLDVVYNVFDFENIINKSIVHLPNEDSSIFNGKVILSVGRVEPIKAPERLVKAFVKSCLWRDGYKLVFVGENIRNTVEQTKETIPDLIAATGSVIFLDYKNNPYPYVRNAVAIASASLSEGLPGILIESLILNKPFVSTNSSMGVWEILSCEDQYDANLKKNVKTKCGIITPNTDDEELNVLQMAEALRDIVGAEYGRVESPFLEKVSTGYVASKYLSCIN